MTDTHVTTYTRRAGSPAKWSIVLLLGAIAVALLIEVVSSTSTARAQVRTGGAKKGVVVVAGNITPQTRGIYLVDLDNDTICVYEYASATKRLRFLAARRFTYDCQLDEYKTEPPPREMKEIVEGSKRLGSAPGQ